MIRPLTLLSIVAAAGAGLHVYNTKHAVSLLDRELRTIARDIQEAETRTQALQAEWSWAAAAAGGGRRRSASANRRNCGGCIGSSARWRCARARNRSCSVAHAHSACRAWVRVSASWMSRAMLRSSRSSKETACLVL